MNGPLPLALRNAKVSCLALKSCAFSTPFFTAQALLIIAIRGSFSGSTASGMARWMSTVSVSTRVAPVTPLS